MAVLIVETGALPFFRVAGNDVGRFHFDEGISKALLDICFDITPSSII